jgi:CBS domain-containing protein
MPLTAADIMHTQVESVTPDTSLPDLERSFIAKKVSALPVMNDGKLVGVVSRSDVVRQLCLEQSHAEILTEGYDETASPKAEASRQEEISHHLGSRIVGLKVQDVMIENPVSIPPNMPVDKLAAEMVSRHVHSLLVVEGESLVGILTSLDLVRLVAEGRSA